MKTRVLLIALVLSQLTTGLVNAATRYVSLSGSNTPGFYSLATAANNIETCMMFANPGDLILVDQGTYVLTGAIPQSQAMTIESIFGPSLTIIDGNYVTLCVRLNNANAVFRGFTIQHGYNPGGFGGGVNIVNGGTLENCIIQNNQARDGGGVALDNGGLIQNCIIRNNLASDNGSAGYGGGVRLLFGGEIRNCLITDNTSIYYGGGVNIWETGIVKNCAISGNTAPHGAGIRTRNNSSVYNSIIYYNLGDNYEVEGGSYFYYNCCSTPALPPGRSSNCISSIPVFISTTPGSEDYHLSAGSPCIDAGMNIAWMVTVPDLDGNPRIVNGTVDLGPYEYFMPAPADADGDGVPDVDDDYPADPARAFNNFYPASGYGTLGFEDLWPSKGDYDFNDLVCDYQFKMVTNASNIIVEMFGTFTIKAFGAGMHNGFGFQFPSSLVNQSHLQVTGYNLQGGSYISLNASGLENGQLKPTIIVLADPFELMANPGAGIGVNTDPSTPYVAPATVTIHMVFTGGSYTIADVDIAHFNPFIICNKNRLVEVHLPDYPPTSLADQAIFGAADDTSDPPTGRYYKTSNNLPWAINIYESFDYPIERIPINNAYLHFIEWGESSGTLYPNWYQNQPGYRNSTYIYHH